jgi:hypothetical protein
MGASLTVPKKGACLDIKTQPRIFYSRNGLKIRSGAGISMDYQLYISPNMRRLANRPKEIV